MNIWDVIILLALLGAVILAFRRIRKRKKEGKSCCGDCGSCSQSCKK